MTTFKTGLIVGKFCPLHKGHEYLIETALEACERLVIISYTKPEYLGCEVEKRRAWLAELYPETVRLVVDDAWLVETKQTDRYERVPDNDTDEHIHRCFTAWLCHSVLGETVDAVFTSEDYGDGFAKVVADVQSAPVQHICVDKARLAVPISGTLIREDPSRYRAYLSDIVFVSFIKRAVFLGGESTGKSTLAKAVAAHLGTEYTRENGRDLWEQRGGELVFEDMLHIAQTQIAREDAFARRSTDWLFCDTSPLTTAFYSQDMFGKTDPELDRLSMRNYDLTFLCAPDFEFVQDGTRQDAAFRARQHDWYLESLHDRQIDFIELKGSLDNRLQDVLAALRR